MGYLHVGKAGQLTKAILTEIKPSGELDYLFFAALPTVVDNDNYLSVNAKDVFQNLLPERTGYVFVRYTLSGTDNLSIYFMDLNQFEKAIRTGKLKGELIYKKRVIGEGVREGDRPSEPDVVDCIRISGSSGNILDFIKNGDAAILFPGAPVNFERQGTPNVKDCSRNEDKLHSVYNL